MNASRPDGSIAATPTVSVVMATHNRAQLLPAAINSVLAQSFDDYELIVVDDGSSDDTVALLESYCDPRIRVIHQDDNRGLPAALNRGYRAARGALCARLDDDDLWLPDMLATTVQALERQPHVGFVYARSYPMDAHARVDGDNAVGSRGRFPDDALASLLLSNCVGHHTALIRREYLEQVDYLDETLPSCEDWDLFIRLARVCQAAFIDRVLALHRLHPGARTHATSPAYPSHLDAHVRVIEKFFASADLPSETRALAPMVRGNIHVEVCMRAFDAGLWHRAWAAFVDALRFSASPAATTGRLGYHLLGSALARQFPRLRGLKRRLRIRLARAP